MQIMHIVAIRTRRLQHSAVLSVLCGSALSLPTRSEGREQLLSEGSHQYTIGT